MITAAANDVVVVGGGPVAGKVFGDTLETWIEGIGTIRNRIIEGS